MTSNSDLITWGHEDGVCKLVRVPRSEIDEDSGEDDAWDLLWLEASTNVRRFDLRLDPVYRRDEWGTGLDRRERDSILAYLDSAPSEAREIIEGLFPAMMA